MGVDLKNVIGYVILGLIALFIIISVGKMAYQVYFVNKIEKETQAIHEQYRVLVENKNKEISLLTGERNKIKSDLIESKVKYDILLDKIRDKANQVNKVEKPKTVNDAKEKLKNWGYDVK